MCERIKPKKGGGASMLPKMSVMDRLHVFITCTCMFLLHLLLPIHWCAIGCCQLLSLHVHMQCINWHASSSRWSFQAWWKQEVVQHWPLSSISRFRVTSNPVTLYLKVWFLICFILYLYCMCRLWYYFGNVSLFSADFNAPILFAIYHSLTFIHNKLYVQISATMKRQLSTSLERH